MSRRAGARREAALALLLLAAGWAATLWLWPWSDETVNDLFVYRVFTDVWLDGMLPYRDALFEYPPLAAPAIGLPGLAGTGEDAFRAAFAGWTFLLGAAVVLLCGALAARTGGDPRRALLAAALTPLLCGALVRTHFDLAPVALLLGALWLLSSGRPRSGMALLGLAVMTKGFPIVVAPVALAWLAARAGRRTALSAAAAFAVALAIPAGAALALSFDGARTAVEFHLERPVQVESLPASGLLLLGSLGAEEPRSVNSHRSDGLEHPAAGALSLVCLIAMLGVLAAIVPASLGGGPRELVLGSLAAVAAFAALGKVLSPQYVLWLIPLGALAFAWRMRALAGAAAAAALLTHIVFPSRYADYVERDMFPVIVVALRNLVLLAVLALALRALLGGRHEQLLDRDGLPARVPLNEDRVEPRVVV